MSRVYWYFRTFLFFCLLDQRNLFIPMRMIAFYSQRIRRFYSKYGMPLLIVQLWKKKWEKPTIVIECFQYLKPNCRILRCNKHQGKFLKKKVVVSSMMCKAILCLKERYYFIILHMKSTQYLNSIFTVIFVCEVPESCPSPMRSIKISKKGMNGSILRINKTDSS